MAAAVMCYQVVLTYKMQNLKSQTYKHGKCSLISLIITLSPLIFVKCILVDILYTVTAVICVPFTALYNQINGTEKDIRDTLDWLYANLMDMRGANVDGVRRLRVVS